MLSYPMNSSSRLVHLLHTQTSFLSCTAALLVFPSLHRALCSITPSAADCHVYKNPHFTVPLWRRPSGWLVCCWLDKQRCPSPHLYLSFTKTRPLKTVVLQRRQEKLSCFTTGALQRPLGFQLQGDMLQWWAECYWNGQREGQDESSSEH